MNKITNGFVIQKYKDGECTEQEFIAGDECEWEDEGGNIIDEPSNAEYMPYNMVQPNDINYLEQGDLVTILELATNALHNESILSAMDLSDEYAKELQAKLTTIVEEKISV